MESGSPYTPRGTSTPSSTRAMAIVSNPRSWPMASTMDCIASPRPSEATPARTAEWKAESSRRAARSASATSSKRRARSSARDAWWTCARAM